MSLSQRSKHRSLTLNLLRAFIAVAETQQMTLAAARLSLTQSAVSQQVKKLEQLFDRTLFHRSSDKMRLSACGEQLLGKAYHLLALSDELFNDMQRIDYTQEIKLGVPADIVVSLLPPILRSFREKHPQVIITLVCDFSHLLHAELEAGRIDIVLLTESQKGTDTEFLLVDQLVWVGVAGGNSVQQRPLPVALDHETCAFRNATTEALNKADIAWRAVSQVGSLEPVFAILKSDLALGTFLSNTVPDYLAVIDDEKLPILPCFYLNMRSSSHYISPLLTGFMAHIRAELKCG